MTINKKLEGKTLIVSVEGQLDSVTSPALEASLRADIGKASNVIFDFEKLEFISSAGLRVILATIKYFKQENAVTVINIQPAVREIFDFTGFTQIMKL